MQGPENNAIEESSAGKSELSASELDAKIQAYEDCKDTAKDTLSRMEQSDMIDEEEELMLLEKRLDDCASDFSNVETSEKPSRPVLSEPIEPDTGDRDSGFSDGQLLDRDGDGRNDTRVRIIDGKTQFLYFDDSRGGGDKDTGGSSPGGYDTDTSGDNTGGGFGA